jgi:inorganic phosphate transporter, PiT family
MTVGNDLFKITPIAAFLVVLTESLILFVFSSESLERLLINVGLPTIPLVPLSSTQVVIGAVIGIGLSKGGREINFRVLGKIAYGWVIAPVSSGLMTFLLLFIVQNVFDQKVVNLVSYEISQNVINKLESEKIPAESIGKLINKEYSSASIFRSELNKQYKWSEDQLFTIFKYAQKDSILIDSVIAKEKMDPKIFSSEQIHMVIALHGRSFIHKWQFIETLKASSNEWRQKDETAINRLYNKELGEKQDILHQLFKNENKK